jgi:hypothetical protein
MNKPAFFLAILMLAALPALAQNTSEFGILVGGSKRVNDVAGSQGEPGVNNFKFSNSGTWVRVKAEEINAPLIVIGSDGKKTEGGKGKIDHVDAIVDYKFSEPFGSTGIFAGVGMYRQEKSGASDTNFGVTAGVNADFPFSRRYGLVVESAYHYIHLPARPRYVTLNAGLRISF